MIYPEELVNLLKKHGYWRVNLFVFIMMCVSVVIAIVFSNAAALVNAMWCGINIFGDYIKCIEKEDHLTTKEKLADIEDQLCISKHDVERLTLELETAQAAIEEAKKPKNYSGYVRAASIDEETAPVEAGPARPKTSANTERPRSRRPAPKKKPKGEETKDENQN